MHTLYNRLAVQLLSLALVLFALPSYAQYIEIIENAESKSFKETVRLVEEYYENRDKGKGSGYKQFKRWEYFHKTRLDERGNVVNVGQRNLQALRIDRERRAQMRIISASPGNWKPLGPMTTAYQNENGRVNCIAVDPANSRIIYAGSAAGGLWRSTDDGASWHCLTDQLSSAIGVSSIVIDPYSDVNNRTLYMLTGDRPLGTFNGLGIWKSTDNGNSWQRLSAPNPNPVYKLIMHPDNPNILFNSNVAGIYKSSNAGATWVYKIKGRFTDIEFHPANPSIVYISGDVGTFRSSDTGETWQAVATGPGASRIELAVTPAAPSMVYAFQGGNTQTAGLYKSTDEGLTFTKVQTWFKLNVNTWYNMALAVSPLDPNIIYAADVWGSKSVDGGVNWNGHTLGHVDHHAFEFYHGYLYVANDGGVVRQNLATGEVENISEGLAITQMYTIAHNSQDAGEFLFGSQDNGTSLLADNRALRIGGGDGMECFYKTTDSKIIYNSSQNGILRRHDRTFVPRSEDINPPGTEGYGAWVTPFLPDPNPSLSDVIYAGFRDLWKSEDRGDTWVNLTNGAIGMYNSSVVAIAPSNNRYIYVFKEDHNMYRSTNGGETWEILRSGWDGPFITSLTIHPANPDVLWATGRDLGSGTGSRRVAKSTDGGRTWTDVSGSLPNISTNCSVYQKNTANGIYIGNDLGVYYKDDTMTDWVFFDAGMPYVIVNDLAINYTEGKIYAGTYGRGAWSSDLYNAPASVEPVVTITTPKQGQTFIAPASVNFSVSASDSDGTVTKVGFYNGSKQIGEDFSSPYSHVWSNVPAGNYMLIARAVDDAGNTGADTVEIAVLNGTSCVGTGKMVSEMWTGISGIDVASIPVNTAPTSTRELSIFENPSNVGDNYGSRVRGYLCVPMSGNYTFWIASDDRSELWLSTDDKPANKVKIAYVSGWTSGRQWDKYTSQKSGPISLVGGTNYYVEALVKEGSGGDHLAVGWQLPNTSLERPIPGNRLIPFQNSANNPPTVSITSPEDGQSFTAPASISFTATASDSDGSISKVEFYNGETKLGEDAISPYAFTWSSVPAGSYSLAAKALDNSGDSATDMVAITVSGGTGESCASTGKIQVETWTGISGTNVSSIPVNSPPSAVSDLTIFETPANIGDNYGSRVRGYICVPTTGNYTFWIASDDRSELWLSTDENPANKARIAYVAGWTTPRQWEKYTTQISAAISLVAGRRYYIEALLKEASGGDHLAVGWQLPGGALERPIPGNRLIPLEAASSTGTIDIATWTGISGTDVSSIPVDFPPNYQSELTIFETPKNVGDNYGSRVRGYLHVPATGSYTFWMASDDRSELWLSTDESPANKVRIAYVSGWTYSRQWDKYATQISAPVNLVGGRKYYIEALLKEGTGGDHLAVGWQLPGGPLERPIPGSRLSEFETSSGAMAQRMETREGETLYAQINIYPNPASRDGELRVGGYENITETIQTQVEIINMMGEVIYAEKVQCGGDCSSYLMKINEKMVPGLYLVNLRTQGTRVSKRLLVK